MIGIGGISMSGIAEILHNWGIFVTGSDSTRSKITDRLASHGIFVSIGHETNLVKKADLVVYTAAVKEDDPEYSTAIRLIKLLDLVLPLPGDDVPSLSILREFIGKGYFE